MKQLLTIAPPTPCFPTQTLHSPGGFVWWYSDMVDAHGNGLVLIWSFGLPFLPGYAAAARRGEPQRPAERPSLNVSVFREGRLKFYLLQELEPHEATWSGLDWRFGDSTIAGRLDGDEWELSVQLDCPLPADASDRLLGSVNLRGVARKASGADALGHAHDWAPMTGPSTTSVDLRAGDQHYAFSGRGYFDGNVGSQPLHEADISEWTWGRAPLRDREAIYYILWRTGDDVPEATGVEIDADGALTQFPLTVDILAGRRGQAGLRHPTSMRLLRDGRLWMTVSRAAVLDDGPFYLRYLIEAATPGEHALGLGEFCRTDRIDLARHRPLVRMRVHRPSQSNSFWLPLFAGPREGRIRRLLSQLTP